MFGIFIDNAMLSTASPRVTDSTWCFQLCVYVKDNALTSLNCFSFEVFIITPHSLSLSSLQNLPQTPPSAFKFMASFLIIGVCMFLNSTCLVCIMLLVCFQFSNTVLYGITNWCAFPWGRLCVYQFLMPRN